MIDIEKKDLDTIQHILKRFVPNRVVWVFGSRIQNTAKAYSDLDLVILGETPLPQAIYYQILDAMEESNVPFRVDLLDWHRINPSFRAIIEKKHVVLPSI
jgi:predicted nucleotidyltransferase